MDPLMNIMIALVICLVIIFSRKLELFYGYEDMDKYNYIPDQIFNHLCFISDILNQNNIRHWLVYGSLLGAVRNGDILGFDRDFDIGADIEDADRIIALNRQLNKKGYLIYKQHVTGYDYATLTQKMQIWRVALKVEYQGISVGDIYLYQRFADGFSRRFDPVNKTYFWPNSTVPTYFFEVLEKVYIKGKEFPAPRDNRILLEQWYGPTWEAELKNADYYNGTVYIQLERLIRYLANKGIYVKPNMDTKINYIYPAEQKRWVEHNDTRAINIY